MAKQSNDEIISTLNSYYKHVNKLSKYKAENIDDKITALKDHIETVDVLWLKDFKSIRKLDIALKESPNIQLKKQMQELMDVYEYRTNQLRFALGICFAFTANIFIIVDVLDGNPNLGLPFIFFLISIALMTMSFPVATVREKTAIVIYFAGWVVPIILILFFLLMLLGLIGNMPDISTIGIFSYSIGILIFATSTAISIHLLLYHRHTVFAKINVISDYFKRTKSSPEIKKDKKKTTTKITTAIIYISTVLSAAYSIFEIFKEALQNLMSNFI